MSPISQELFGKTADGRNVTRFTLSNNNGVTIKILNYGGIITDILLSDNNGNVKDICLGFDDMEGYLTRSPYFGALIGRYANRIAAASFEMDGKTYKLAANNGPNALHGGVIGFDKVIWTPTIDGNKLVLKYASADGEEGYPGELTVTVIYELTNDNELKLDYKATTTTATPVNLTNHTYFNLDGHDSNNLNDHMITIPGHSYTVLDENTIPTGEIRPVDGTLFDLRKPVKLGDVLGKVNNGLGFDNNFHLNTVDGLQLGARIEHPPSGRYIECYTTEPGMQFYTCKNLKDTKGKNGVVYKQFGGFCLEAQHYPDSVHHAQFPNTILHEGDTYSQKTVYKFGVKI